MMFADPVSRTIAVALLALGAVGVVGLAQSPTVPTSAPAVVKPVVLKKIAAAPQLVTAPAPVAQAAVAAAPIVPAAGAMRPLNEPYVIKHAMTINEPIVHGFWKWDDAGVPDGPMLITVDTVAQTMSVFRAGHEIGVVFILYGANSKPTPNGIFPILQKKVHHISNLYGAPMPYMQRLTNDGIAIHASEVVEGRATHGCIGLPMAFAKLLFGATKLGDRVIVTSGERLQVGGAVGAH
jgi:lipoprotein-anchoring transpeptidase ErfK/SrfK